MTYMLLLNRALKLVEEISRLECYVLQSWRNLLITSRMFKLERLIICGTLTLEIVESHSKATF